MREIFFTSIITQSKKLKSIIISPSPKYSQSRSRSSSKAPLPFQICPMFTVTLVGRPAHSSHWLLNLYPVNLFHHNFHHNHHVNINIIVIIIIFMIFTSSSPSWSWWLSSSQLFLNLHCTHSPLSLSCLFCIFNQPTVSINIIFSLFLDWFLS